MFNTLGMKTMVDQESYCTLALINSYVIERQCVFHFSYCSHTCIRSTCLLLNQSIIEASFVFLLMFSVRLLSVQRGHSLFSSPPQLPIQWTPTSKDLYPRFYPLHVCPILILQKEPVFPVLMLNAKQRNNWYYFYNAFGMTRVLIDWELNAGPHVLEDSTLPLG